MAKYQVQATCGHSYEVQLQGAYRERERRLERLAEEACPECREAANTAQTTQRAQQASEQAQADGLPELQGTDKQIAWAADIRATILEQAADLEARNAAAIAAGTAPIEMTTQVATYLASLRTQAQASWWIDRRSETALSLLRAAVA